MRKLQYLLMTLSVLCFAVPAFAQTGATGVIRGNWFVGGPDKENRTTFISNAPEGHAHSADGLTIDGNVARLAPGAKYDTAFLVDWSGDAIRLGSNTIGTGIRRFEKR